MKKGKEKLFKKWLKSKVQLDQALAKERHLRQEMEDHYLIPSAKKVNFQIDEKKIAISRNINYSIQSKSVKELREEWSSVVFEDVFYASYKLKETGYKRLPKEEKKQIDEVLVIKAAPCTILVKDV